MTKQQFDSIMKRLDTYLENKRRTIGQEIMWQYEEDFNFSKVKMNDTIKESLGAIMILKTLVNDLLQIQQEDEEKIQ